MNIPLRSPDASRRRLFQLSEDRKNQTNFARWLWQRSRFLLIAVVILPSSAAEQATGDLVAVYSSVSPDYNRVQLPGGGFKTETYSFGEGENSSGKMNDFSIDQLHFSDIAGYIAPALAAKRYVPAKKDDPEHTDLLIMVYWGMTSGTQGAGSSPEYQIAQGLIPPPPPPPPPPPTGQTPPGGSSVAQQAAVIKAGNEGALAQADIMIVMGNRARDQQNRNNAVILGYLTELQRVADYGGTALGRVKQDIVDDVEENRYYVVLLAYDFQILLKNKQRKLLWETRFSIRERGHNFSEQLASMAQHASRYFGQNSQGLVRKPMPTTNIKLGDLKFLDYDAESKK